MSYSNPASPSTPTAASTGVQLAHDSEVLIRTYIPPSPESGDGQAPPAYDPSVPVLPLPICIPQVSAKPTSLFARGYNEYLGSPEIGISQEVFLQFIDGLNLAITASPPLRVVDIIGKGIGFV